MGHRPLPAVRDFTRDGRWSTYDVSVLKKMGGGGGDAHRPPLKLPSPTNLARLDHFPPASQAGRLAGPVFYVYVFSQEKTLVCRIRLLLRLLPSPPRRATSPWPGTPSPAYPHPLTLSTLTGTVILFVIDIWDGF
jgi:hypothetical protein